MKKLFLAICFMLISAVPAFARVTPVSGYENLKYQPPAEQTEPEVHEVEFNDFKDFLADRFKSAVKADPKTVNQNVGYLPSLVRQQMEQESQKGFFEKIYDQALNRVSPPADSQRDDVAQPASLPAVEQQQQAWQQTPGVPLVTAYLPPDNRPTAVPALEHIPYLMNSIEVLPSGLVKFEETIVVVGNGEKLHRGLTKILPQEVRNAAGDVQRLDYSVIGVRVNDMPVEYHLTSNGRNILLVPADDYRLQPGIYTYKFEYVVDNLLWDYGNYYQLYWDIGGNGWNLVVDRLGASLNLPRSGALLDQVVLLGSPLRLDSGAVNISPNGPSAMAYVASRPLFVGEGMHLIANIDKKALTVPGLWQKIMRALYNHGDIYFALLGLAVITFSFAVSWRYIAKDRGQLKLKFNRTAAAVRLLLYDRFDIKSVCGFLLELYNKNIIDIQQSGNTILLIKRTDNLKSLEKWEQKALRRLFPAHETVFNVNRNNKLPFKRFAADLEAGIRRQLGVFRFKLNIGYLLSGAALVAMIEAFIASLRPDAWYVFTVMGITSVICLSAMFLWNFFRRRWLKAAARLLVLDIVCLSLIVLSAVIHPLAALLLLFSLAVIVAALHIYGRRLGLIKHYIQDIGRFRDYLVANHDNIVLGRDLVNYQPLIWALDLETDFVPVRGSERCKLQTVEDIAAMWS